MRRLTARTGIQTWIEYKREFEIDMIRPHPHEFAMFYEI
jgi:hypothetical protein